MHSYTRRLVLAAGITAVAIASFTLWRGQPPVGAAADAGVRTITVSGQGEVLATPDMATSYFGVEAQGSNSQDALARAGQPPAVIGYRASNSVNVKVRDLSRLSAVLDGAVAAGASYAGGVHFGFNNDDDLRQRALKAAVRNARAKADALADAAGVAVTTVQAIAEGGIAMPGPYPVEAPGAVGPERAPATPVQPGTQTITGSVSATFLIG